VTLPTGWVETTLGEIAQLRTGPFGSTVHKSDYIVGGVPLINPMHIVHGKICPSPRVTVSKAKAEQLIEFKLKAGDVLIGRRGEMGRCAVVHSIDAGNLIGTGSMAITPSLAIATEYLRRLLASPDVVAILEGNSVGSTMVNLNQGILQRLPVPLPPLAEQRRIVAKLDTLTARLRRARTELDRVAAMAKTMRQATLASAFSGTLTRSFRGDTSVEGASGFPASWTVERLDEISEIQGGIQVGKQRPRDAKLVEVPYLRVANVQRGWLKLDEIKTIRVTLAEKERLLLRAGDILMNEGGDRDKLGRGWIWSAQIDECIHQNHVFRIRLKDRLFPAEFVSHYANENGQQYFLDQGTQTTNLASISKKRVGALPVPLPPIAEALEIMRLIGVAFARADRLEAEAARARALLDRLGAAILARAFRGELVPQDPADEPATALLNRIRETRAATPKPKRGRRAATANAA
jgi:type I restriction enzyme, S subunit